MVSKHLFNMKNKYSFYVMWYFLIFQTVGVFHGDMSWYHCNMIWCHCHVLWCHCHTLWCHYHVLWCHCHTLWCHYHVLWCHNHILCLFRCVCNRSWFCLMQVVVGKACRMMKLPWKLTPCYFHCLIWTFTCIYIQIHVLSLLSSRPKMDDVKKLYLKLLLLFKLLCCYILCWLILGEFTFFISFLLKWFYHKFTSLSKPA
jgi:hypothetical protein